MVWKLGTIAVCASLIGAFALESPPAAAQQTQNAKKKPPRARLVVAPRSFLDAGTEVLPGERKFTDYAFPPGYSVLGTALGPGRDFRRQPLNDPWDIPGSIKW